MVLQHLIDCELTGLLVDTWQIAWRNSVVTTLGSDQNGSLTLTLIKLFKEY